MSSPSSLLGSPVGGKINEEMPLFAREKIPYEAANNFVSGLKGLVWPIVASVSLYAIAEGVDISLRYVDGVSEYVPIAIEAVEGVTVVFTALQAACIIRKTHLFAKEYLK